MRQHPPKHRPARTVRRTPGAFSAVRAGQAIRGVRIARAAAIGAGSLGLTEIGQLIFDVDSLISNWRDVSRVRALRNARRLKRELQSAERHLDNLLTNWNNAQCSLYIDENGRIIP